MRRILLFLPLVLFAAVALAFALRLYAPGDAIVRSRMVGKPLPEFALEPIVANHPGLAASDLRSGGPRLVNVFASWCVPCRTEAPQLEALRARGIRIDAIAIRDKSEDVARFLREHGDPFDRIGDDPHSRVQMALGSSGVPETFVVDGGGVVRHQHVGEIRADDVAAIVAAWEAAR